MKYLHVRYGAKDNQQFADVELNSVAEDEPLTPKLARRALEIATGKNYDGIVWDSDNEPDEISGYRLYPNSHRKLYCWQYEP